ncbi:hypothetical protein PICMEDRAFT_14529 [Pichia membranifaciens NRRL Y-2026]|uniref:Uncharacterized protein n=1 Tax=Pichia membranifaciens NRRL Y-2026 TaxID=763406 RepID=A0A1E3NU04_9ASCO|nr:hypothetical protein PICMEDRAFT_14529 [Pichia membranifaciens NRRL Y-2026]ODQ49033.1 hypothetical protein PICMEDRAFT_14529 [Pichia membranifaciens NRRL Y-2026]
MVAISSYLLGTVTLAGAFMGYVKKGSVPSLLAGGLVSVIYFVGGALASKGRRSGLIISLAASVILLIAGFARAILTKFEKTVPLVLTGIGLLSTAYYGYLLV